jgi:hypothetical protein
MTTRSPTRRTVLKGTGALATLALAPATLCAQGEPVRLGVLTPLTGAGSADGPRMLAAMQAVAKEINAAGGVLGRQIEFIIEDDQTNPDAAVKAARKLIDVGRVPVIMGTWASAVTTAVAPLCWESKTFLTTVSGADTITKLPHQGYLIRTQPNNFLQATAHGKFLLGLGVKRVFALSIQATFARSRREPERRSIPPSKGWRCSPRAGRSATKVPVVPATSARSATFSTASSASRRSRRPRSSSSRSNRAAPPQRSARRTQAATASAMARSPASVVALVSPANSRTRMKTPSPVATPPTSEARERFSRVAVAPALPIALMPAPSRCLARRRRPGSS